MLLFWVLAWFLPGVLCALQFTVPFNVSLFTSGTIETANGLSIAAWELSGDSLSVAVAAKTNGFVGFGINYSPTMSGADIVLAQADGNGQIVLRDMHATGYIAPIDDLTTDIIVESAQRANGITWFTYRRNLTTCDTKGDMQLQNGVAYYGLLAFGATDALAYHGSFREALPLSLTAPVSVALPPSAVTVDIVAPPTPVPLGAGSYVCSYHQLPNASRYHIVKYQTIQGSSAANGVLHHVNMNACEGPQPGLTVGSIVPCGSVMNCNTGLISGGYGAGVSLPTDVGIAIGSGAVEFVIISRHFYNPGNLQGVVDVGTKFSLWYTSELRPNEIGVLSLAQLNITIPAGSTRHDVLALLPSNCTQTFPPTGITVTAVGVHMHESGLAAAVRVIRNGAELAPLGIFDPWDASHPAMNTLYQLLPGDYVRATCTYNNPYNYSLHEGSSLSDEMCVFSLTYYPKIDGFPGAADFADGFASLPPAAAPACGPGGSCTYCSPGAACGTGGTCQTICAGMTTGGCANCALCTNCAQCVNCNFTAPRVFCSANNISGLIFDPPERYSSFTPFVSNSNCPIITAAPTPQPDPGTHVVNWRVPALPTRLVVAAGDKVNFVWTGNHDVVSLTAAKFSTCDLTGSTTLASSGGTYQWTATTPGDFYFACAIGAHCSGGMKLWVTVQAAGSHPVNWAIPTVPSTVHIALGESVALAWVDSHDVWLLPNQRAYETCDFTGATELKATTAESSFDYTPTQLGVFYLACRLPGHCSGSMKLQVVVGASSAPSPALPFASSAWPLVPSIFISSVAFFLA